uniref:EGF-like domain-containing protein n=1 Tax=Erpetoichthys calabaricus TaxID=27687 RepID=A0A8C4XBH9_ERPCA
MPGGTKFASCFSSSDVDECAETPGLCDGIGVCENALGSYRCVCQLGYRGNGTHCEDVDECSLNNGGCQHICSNIPGTYQCSCRDGYQLMDDTMNCTDIDECTLFNGTCDQTCTNTKGSFLCSCQTGFQLHVDNRQYIDECKLQNGGCSHGCTNRLGGYSCECPTLLVLDMDNRTCVNILDFPVSWPSLNFLTEVLSCPLAFSYPGLKINLCSVNSLNGGCSHICTERVAGEVECSCRAGWELSDNQRVCQGMAQGVAKSKTNRLIGRIYSHVTHVMLNLYFINFFKV